MNLSAYRAQRRARATKLASLPAAIAQTRNVFEGDTGAEQALDYLEQVLAAGLLGAADKPQTRMDDSSKPATSGAKPVVSSGIASLTISIDTTSVTQALAQAEQLKLAAEGAAVALAVIGGALESAAADDTLVLVLEELRGLRADLAAGRAASVAVLA